MYDINGDVTFDDYTIDIDDEYVLNDYDTVDENNVFSESISTDTDIQFE